MAGIQINEAKAPWIMFERRAVEDRAESIAQGRYVAKDVDFVLITPHGSKDQIERVVSEWFEHNEQEVAQGRLDLNWHRKYQEAYENWVSGKEVPLEGTPIINWPLLSPAQVRALQDLKILTVEVLANANEEAIRRLGMGGRNLVAKAKEFIAQTERGKSVEQVVALEEKVRALELMNKAQAERLDQMMAALGKGASAAEAPSATGESSEIGLGDLLESPPAVGAKRKL